MSYDFMMLSPSDFESLVCDILSKYLNMRLESFKPGKDKGIDLRHSLSLKEKNDIIIQCKRYAPHKINDLKRELKNNELSKIIKLSPSRYLIATSVALSAENKKSIVDDLAPWILSNGDVFGTEDLNKLLRDYPEIERSHFKLWISSTAVLERILNAKVLSQTAATIDEIKNDASKFVMHSGFNKALEVLSEKHHILIVGNPGIGKTTLAKMIMCHYMEDGFEPISIMNNIDDIWGLIHSDGISERRLVILYDDFLGRVQFNADKFGKNEDRSLLSLLDLVSRNNNIRLILTTREYILEDAKRIHGSFQSRADEILRYSLSLNIYAKRERASILFNHLFFSNLPNERLQCLVETKSYLDVINHKGFNPRIVQIVSDYANSKAMNNEEFIEFFKREFDNPANLWEHPFRREISPVARKLLLVLWTFNGQSELDDLESAVASYVNPTDHFDFKNMFNDALKQLDGNFVSTERLRGGSFKKNYFIIKFQNPSVEEFVQSVIYKSSLLSDLISSCITYEQVDKIYTSSQGVPSNNKASLLLALRNKLLIVKESFSGTVINVQFYNAKNVEKCWSPSQDRKASVLITMLKIENSLKMQDEYNSLVMESVISQKGWLEVLSILFSSDFKVFDIYNLRKWIVDDSGWSKSILELSQISFQKAVCEILKSDRADFEAYILDSLIESLFMGGFNISKDTEEIFIKSVLNSVRDEALEEMQHSQLEEHLDSVRNISNLLKGSLDSTALRLEEKINSTDYYYNEAYSNAKSDEFRYEQALSDDKFDVEVYFQDLIER